MGTVSSLRDFVAGATAAVGDLTLMPNPTPLRWLTSPRFALLLGLGMLAFAAVSSVLIDGWTRTYLTQLAAEHLTEWWDVVGWLRAAFFTAAAQDEMYDPDGDGRANTPWPLLGDAIGTGNALLVELMSASALSALPARLAAFLSLRRMHQVLAPLSMPGAFTVILARLDGSEVLAGVFELRFALTLAGAALRLVHRAVARPQADP